MYVIVATNEIGNISLYALVRVKCKYIAINNQTFYLKMFLMKYLSFHRRYLAAYRNYCHYHFDFAFNLDRRKISKKFGIRNGTKRYQFVVSVTNH